MRRRALLGGLAALAAAPATGQELRRLTLRGDLLGWEGVGRLDLDDGFCTGVLVAPDLVLTAAHCLVDRRGARRDPAAVTFRAGLRDGAPVAERRGLRAVLHPDYDPADPDGLRQLRADVALVQLDAPIPAGTAAPFAPGGSVRTGAEVSVISYATGREEAPSRQRACAVTGHGPGVLRLDCDGDFGASGAPVFRLEGGVPRIVSVISRGNRAERAVFGMEAGPALAAVRDALRTRRGVWPETQVEARRLRPGERGETGARFLRP